jgi:hypothetical protein
MKPTFTRIIALVLLTFALSFVNNIHAQTNTSLTTKSLAGGWKAKIGGEEYILNGNRTSMSTVNGCTCPGTWTVEGSMLVINPKRINWPKNNPCGQARKFEIVSHTTNKMTLVESGTKRTIELENQE